VTTIDHIIITVEDLPQATRDYTSLLGRAPSWQGQHPAYGTANVLFQLENTYIELLAAQGDGFGADLVRTFTAKQPNCLAGLVFGVEDSAAFVTRARARGLPVQDPQPGHGIDSQSGRRRDWQNLFWDPSAARGVFSFAIEHTGGEPLVPAPATAADPVAAVDHIVVQTRSSTAAKQFYGEQLGLRLALEREVPDWGGRFLFFRTSHMSIEVIASEKTGDTDRLWGIALRCTNLEATYARLQQAGITVTEPKPGRKPGTQVSTVKSSALGIPTLLVQQAV